MEHGQHCAAATCSRLDFLPFTCIYCKKTHCSDHSNPTLHSCSVSEEERDARAIVCPVCHRVVPTPSPDPGTSTLPPRKKNVCSMKGCNKKETTSVKCKSCFQTFCLTHRHEVDHKCPKRPYSAPSSPKPSPTIKSAPAPKPTPPSSSEAADRDLALALQLSLDDQNQRQQRGGGAASNGKPKDCLIQ
ncbi:hypothetical protein BC829DRAFT_384648 [Chytridium lagenaria]|nr:hypothetical protein BC829DRAFT_384648 [Chytridium lagenaria]